jgi:hypothetical protein
MLSMTDAHHEPVSEKIQAPRENIECAAFSGSDNVEEEQYLTLIKEILETGNERSDRTGVGTEKWCHSTSHHEKGVLEGRC